jgi:GntR family transcriptional regulator
VRSAAARSIRPSAGWRRLPAGRARLATAEESRLLNTAKRGAVLNLLLAVYGADDRPLEVVDAVLPGDLHELEDLYPFSA